MGLNRVLVPVFPRKRARQGDKKPRKDEEKDRKRKSSGGPAFAAAVRNRVCSNASGAEGNAAYNTGPVLTEKPTLILAFEHKGFTLCAATEKEGGSPGWKGLQTFICRSPNWRPHWKALRGLRRPGRPGPTELIRRRSPTLSSVLRTF